MVSTWSDCVSVRGVDADAVGGRRARGASAAGLRLALVLRATRRRRDTLLRRGRARDGINHLKPRQQEQQEQQKMERAPPAGAGKGKKGKK